MMSLREYPISVRFLLALLMAIVMIGALWYVLLDREQVDIGVYDDSVTPPESMGLAEPLPDAQTVSIFGNLYLTSPAEFYPVNDTVSYSRVYDFQKETLFLTAITPQRDYQPVDDTTAIVLSRDEQQPRESTWRPYRYDVSTEQRSELPVVEGYWFNDLTLAADNDHYAYTFMEDVDPAPGVRDPSFWSIAVHSMNSEDTRIIANAIEPTWVNGGAALLYISTDGIHLYDLQSGDDQVLFTDYTPYDYHDDLAVSPDSNHVVLTVPFIAGRTMLSVLALTTGEESQLVEIGRIVSDDTKRRSPVFSPDSRYYAVMAAKETRSDGSRNIPETEKVIEIRALESQEPVRIIDLPEEEALSVELESWTR